MTREEFIQDVNSVSELLDFCWHYNCECCNDIISEETRDERIDDDVVQIARDSGWQDAYDWLSRIRDTTGYDYYIDDGDEYRPLWDDEFDYYKEEVLEWADMCGDVFDEEEPDDDEEEQTQPEEPQEEEFVIEDEDCTVQEMIFSAFVVKQSAEQEQQAPVSVLLF